METEKEIESYREIEGQTERERERDSETDRQREREKERCEKLKLCFKAILSLSESFGESMNKLARARGGKER